MTRSCCRPGPAAPWWSTRDPITGLRAAGVAPGDVTDVVCSHFHVDHVGGVAGVFRGREVGAVVGPDWPDPRGGRAAVQAAAGRVPLHAVGPGWSVSARSA